MWPSHAPSGGKANHGSGSKCPFSRRFSNRAARAGLSVSELNAEITVETAMVRANWRKNWPMMPVMKAHGTNTADSTRPMATTGPDTCSIALIVASRGARPCSMWCSTASTTTMASSTTMPMASTRPNSVRLFRLKPIAAMTAKVPTTATGTAISGISDDRQFCKKISTTTATSSTASNSVSKTSLIDSLMNGVVS